MWYFADTEMALKGFIYPQAKGGNLIVAMWNLVDVEPLGKDFYQQESSMNVYQKYGSELRVRCGRR